MSVLLEKALYRPIGQPCEIAGYQELYTVVGLQPDEPDAIELEQQLYAFGLGNVVNLDNLLGRDVVQRAHGNQEQLDAGCDPLFLLLGELGDQGLLPVEGAS